MYFQAYRPSPGFSFTVVVLLLSSAVSISQGVLHIKEPDLENQWKNATTIYDFVVSDIMGRQVSLERYRGLVLIVVNTASKCAANYLHMDQLIEIHNMWFRKGLRILIFPSNQFGLEPLDANGIYGFFRYKYETNFDLFDKVVINTDERFGEAHPLYKYLQNSINGFIANNIKWNFTKFVINRQGIPVERFAANITPEGMKVYVKPYL